MKFLCLAYGSETDWKALSKPQQDALLAQDDVLRERGAMIFAVHDQPTTVTAWDGTANAHAGAFANARVPLAGFSIIDAADLDEAIALVKGTPCARAGGAIVIRPIIDGLGNA